MGAIIDDLMNTRYQRFINLQFAEMDACDFGLIYVGLIAIFGILEFVISRILGLFGINNDSNEKGRFTSKAWSIVAIMATGTIGVVAWITYEFNLPCSVIETYNTIPITLLKILTMSYLSYDTLAHNIGYDMHLHHFIIYVSICSIFLLDYSRYSAHGALVTELSSPVLSLIHLSSGTTKLIFMITFVMIFFLTRIVFLGHVWYRCYECYTPTVGDALCVGLIRTLYVLNCYWFVFILKKGYGTLTGSSEKIKGKIE